MVIGSVTSKNGVGIRLTEERWKHIILMHPNLTERQSETLATVKNPKYIQKGSAGELLAVEKLTPRTYFVVIYKEAGTDGFIITAYKTTDTRWLFKKEIIWNKHL